MLKNKLPESTLNLLPSGYQQIGDILIINLHQDLENYSKEIGEVILKNIPRVRIVCNRKGPIIGQYREPILDVIAGDNNTITIHRENHCLFKIDVSKLMFAKGNIKERGRLPHLIVEGETIVDMFAGIGYFSIPIAVLAKPKKVFAIDINPTAIEFLKENISLNKVEDKVVPLLGDCREVAQTLGKIADRVIMGFLPETYKFLPTAFTILKKEGGIIHYHDVFFEDELFEKPVEILKKYAINNGYKLKEVLHKRIVKGYAPKKYHIVTDTEFCGQNGNISKDR